MSDDVKATIRKFIAEEVMFEPDAVIREDQPLLGEVLDSLGLMQLVEFIENHYDVEVADEDVLPENFESLPALERYVTSLKG